MYSNACKHFTTMMGEFERRVTDIVIGAMDGFNPLPTKLCKWSTWPAFAFGYNLLSWMIIKQFFVLSLVLMHGPRLVKGKKIDVYMQPLLEELKEVWEPCTIAYDHCMHVGEGHFTLRVGVMTTIGDYLGLGMISRCAHHGGIGCILCGRNVTSKQWNELGKTAYKGSQ